MANKTLRLFLAVLLIPGAPIPLADADEAATLTAVADASLNQGAPTTNQGTATDLVTRSAASNNRRALIRFDLTSIPPTSAIKTSLLKLKLTTPPLASRSQAAHRVTGNPPWSEAGVTWNSRDGATNWTIAGGDFDSVAADTQPSGTTAGATLTWTIRSDGTVSNIPQGWLDGSVLNRGLLAKDATEDGAPSEWWDASYQFRQRVTLTAGTAAVPSGYSVSVTFDHATLVTPGKSQAGGDDIRIVYWNGSGWVELDRSLDESSAWDTGSTKIWLRTQAAIGASASDNNYYLYYGNATAASPPANKANVFDLWDDFTAGSDPPTGWTEWCDDCDSSPQTVLSTVSAGILTIDSGGGNVGGIRHNTYTPGNTDGFVARTRARSVAVVTDDLAPACWFINAPTGETYCYQTRDAGANRNRYVRKRDSTQADGTDVTIQSDTTTGPFPVANTWYTYEVQRRTNGTMRAFRDGTQQFPPTAGTWSTADTTTTAGSFGLGGESGAGQDYEFDWLWARKLVDPEPTTALGGEEQPGPRYGSRESSGNEPQLEVRYLRDVTLNPFTGGISEVTLNWTFPTGSTSSNYDGVLFAKRQGGSAPTFAPSDATNYNVGDEPVVGETLAVNTTSFSPVSAVDENGVDSVVLPSTQYTYKGYTHDATTITGAASASPPHYAFGVSGSVTTASGGGTSKNWSYKTGATTLAAPGLIPGSTVVTGGNDSKVHSMSSVNGGRRYRPLSPVGTTGGAIQSRPPVIPAASTSHPTCAGACDVVYVGAGDGKVYAFRTDTGAKLWESVVLTTGVGSGIQGAPAVQLKAFSNAGFTPATDLVIVGTRNVGSTTNNSVVALNGNTGAVVWTFAPGNLDSVNSTPVVDYTNNTVWVSSRAGSGGGQPSLWKLNSNTGGLLESFTLGDIDGSPTLNLDGKQVYVVTNAGSLVAARTDVASCTFTASPGTGAGVGYPIPIAAGTDADDIFFSTATTLNKVNFSYGAASCSGTFTTPATGWTNPSLSSPSAPIFSPPPLTLFLYVGDATGRLRKIDPSSGAILASRDVNLAATIGEPSFDVTSLKLYVGDTSGRIYSFDQF